jgi:hypothetical protein
MHLVKLETVCSKFETFMAMKIQVILWVVTLCSDLTTWCHSPEDDE